MDVGAVAHTATPIWSPLESNCESMLPRRSDCTLLRQASCRHRLALQGSAAACCLGARHLTRCIVSAAAASSLKDMTRLRRRASSRLFEPAAASSSVLTAEPVRSQACSDVEKGCAYYINLARRPDRHEKMQQLFKDSGSPLLQRAQRINAIDGREMQLHFHSGTVWSVVDPAAVARGMRAQRAGLYTVVHHGGAILHFNDHLTNGGIACAMSHQAALRACASHPTADWGLILEDDVSATVPDVDEAIGHILKKLPLDWDAVLLGHHDRFGRLAEAGGANLRHARVVQMLSHEFGLFAWIVRRDAAQLLLKHAFPVEGQVDKALTSWLVRERFRCFKVEACNLLFYSPKSEERGDSDVQSLGSIDRVLDEHGSVDTYNIRLLAERDRIGLGRT